VVSLADERLYLLNYASPFMRYIALLLILSFAYSGLAQADSVRAKPSGFIDFNGYYDTRKQTDFNINILAILPHNFSYFSLTNYNGSSNTSDVESFYTEQNLIWKPFKNVPIKLDLQGVLKSGDSNDALRFGPRFQMTKIKPWKAFFEKINFNYFVTTFLIQGNQGAGIQWMSQIEHVYKLNLFKRRVYLGGFADQNFQFDQSQKIKWVTEHQLGVRIIREFYFVTEFRVNHYLEDDTGLGVGFEYKIKF